MITFITCSHKAPPGLFACLQTIAAQARDVPWEAILVNNGFDAGAEQRIAEFARGQNLEDRIRVIREPRPGLGFARAKAFHKARGSWFVMLDDDNTIASDFCRNLQNILAKYPSIGGITPMISPVWEKEPSGWVAEHAATCLSFNEPTLFKQRPVERSYKPEQFDQAPGPPGGGMIIHRKVAEAYLDKARSPWRMAMERTGDSLVGFQDHDIWRGLHDLHMAILITDRLQVWHHIPAQRLRILYLLRLSYSMGYSFQIFERILGRATTTGVVSDTGRSLLTMLRLVKMGLTEPSTPFGKQLMAVAREVGRLAGVLKRLPLETEHIG